MSFDQSPIKRSDVFGWLTNELNVIRNVHFVLIILSAFCAATWLSLEPRNIQLEHQFLALRDQMGISGRVTWSAYGFYNWIFSDQLVNHPLVGDYADHFWSRDFIPLDHHFAARPTNEPFKDTLDYLNTLAVKGVMYTKVQVDDKTRNDFEHWKRLVKEQGKSYISEIVGFFPMLKPAEPRYSYVCFTMVKGKCEKLTANKDPYAVFHIPNLPDDDVFLLKGMLIPETLTLSPSQDFINKNTSAISQFLIDNPKLKDARWDTVADEIFRPLLSPTSTRTLPLLGVDVGPRYLIPILAGLVLLVQIYWMVEVASACDYAKFIGETWPDKPVFFAPWIGARPHIVSIVITAITAVIIPAVSAATLFTEYGKALLSSLPTGYTLEELNAQRSDTQFGSTFAIFIIAIPLIVGGFSLLYEGKVMRNLYFQQANINWKYTALARLVTKIAERLKRFRPSEG